MVGGAQGRARLTRVANRVGRDPRPLLWRAAKPKESRWIAQNGVRAFGAIASSTKKHWFVGSSQLITDVRCRSPVAIVAAHR
eukprot:70984-Prymnesium_polylepis.1